MEIQLGTSVVLSPLVVENRGNCLREYRRADCREVAVASTWWLVIDLMSNPRNSSRERILPCVSGTSPLRVADIKNFLCLNTALVVEYAGFL